MGLIARLFLLLCSIFVGLAARAQEPVSARERLSRFVTAPMSVGKAVNDRGVFELLNSGGGQAGYVFSTAPLAPLPGFSGAPINMLVVMDLDGRFIDVRLMDHNEPIFVSGLGEAPFHKFLEQYRGHSINESLVVGTPYGKAEDSSSLAYLDGVTKATASVRIAHESILAAANAVAREKMKGVGTQAPVRPDPAVNEALDWQALLDQGIVRRLRVTNREMDARFKGTRWADDDAEARAHPDDAYLDLYIADLGPPAVARALLDDAGFAKLQAFLRLTPFAEPILLIDAGRHGLVSPKFVRNTAPDWLTAVQDGLPVALRDADLSFDLRRGVPQGTAMIIRSDRRLGFDPTRPWKLNVLATREHGQFMPEVGSVTLSVEYAAPERFFTRNVEVIKVDTPLIAALKGRAVDLVVLAAFLVGLFVLLLRHDVWLAERRRLAPLRLGVLAFVLGFVGWWGQGQLSIVTPLSMLRAGLQGGSLQFLLFDPFSLLIWLFVIVGFVLWGRGFFCGWLCPFGALQEFVDVLARKLKLPKFEPSPAWDSRLKGLKYIVLASLVGVVILAPQHMDKAAEVEPFKTAISVFFLREWWFVAYAVFWLGLAAFTFKGFCRYVCPLGAVMAIGGLLRSRKWIERRAECGSPCKLCTVKCRYGAISARGKVSYSECFQCLDCVQIFHDVKQCVPRVLATKRASA